MLCHSHAANEEEKSLFFMIPTCDKAPYVVNEV